MRTFGLKVIGNECDFDGENYAKEIDLDGRRVRAKHGRILGGCDVELKGDIKMLSEER